MLKSLTFSAALALALGASSVSFAGGILHHNAMPSAQCETASPQSVAPSPQGECGAVCGPVKKHCFSGMMAKFHKPKCYTYEWVLKKKRVHGGCGAPAGCETCSEGVYPSGQFPSAQGYAAPQGYGSSQIAAPVSSGQLAPTTSSQIAPAPAAVEPPAAPAMPAPPAPPTASNGVLFLTPAGN